ncbi:MAG TPA: PEGA domain-containing protein [Kofleriaceae bacterium]
MAFALSFVLGSARVSVASSDQGAVLVIGTASPKDRATVQAAVRTAARSWDLIETPLPDADIAQIVSCLNSPQLWSCADAVTASRGIQRLIVVSVEPDRAPDGKPALTLTERIALHGSDVTTDDQRYCPHCTDESLSRIAFDLTKATLEAASASSSRTKLTIRSTPHGAWITLDNANVGLTDHTYSTYPGHHVVIVQRQGYEPEMRDVDVSENGNTVVDVTLHEPSSGHRYVLPGIVTGAGAVLLVGGIVLQATKDPPSAPPQPKYLVSGPGIGLMVVGGLALGAGVYLIVRAATHGTTSSTPIATLTNGGGIIGWSGSF